MATIRQRKPGVWEVRVFVGNDDRGRPKQVSAGARPKRDAQRGRRADRGAPAAADGRTVADALEAGSNAPPGRVDVRDQTSRASLVKADKIARMHLARLTVADVDRWPSRRAAGVGESSLRTTPGAAGFAVAGGSVGLGPPRGPWPPWAGARPSHGRR